MVDFVLDAGRKQAVGLELARMAVNVEIADPAAGRPLDLFVIFGDRQAALLIGALFVGTPGDLRIDQDDRIVGLVFLRGVDHHDPLRHRDLDCRKADARRIVHGFKHVVGELADLVVDLFDRLGDLAQARIRNEYDFPDCHGAEIGDRAASVNRAKACESRMIQLMNETLFMLGERTVSVSEALIAGAAGVLVLMLAILVAMLRVGKARAVQAAADAERAWEMEFRLSEMMKTQDQMAGRMQTMTEVFGTRQSELARGLTERLDGFGQRLGEGLRTTAKSTHDSLAQLNERLAVIDNAQRNITELSSQVVGLQTILANKQTRGAFGQGRMEAIVADGLPERAYQFQGSLSNNTRPDCLITLPGTEARLVIDAKFPLEAFHLYRDAETAEQTKAAGQRLRQDVDVHIKDISGKYLIPGETQDIAIMFVPSESVYADLHEHFEDVVQKAHRVRVIIVGPSMLMLSIQVMQSILRDAQMREQAHIIQKEVAVLGQDVGRLRDRVMKLQQHFGQAGRDIEQIVTSADKITKRGERIEQLDFGEEEETPPAPRLVSGSDPA